LPQRSESSATLIGDILLRGERLEASLHSSGCAGPCTNPWRRCASS